MDIRFWRRKDKIKDAQAAANELYRMLFANAMHGVPIREVSDGTSAIVKGYLYNHIIYAIVNRITGAIAGVPWQVYRIDNVKAHGHYGAAMRAKSVSDALYYKDIAYTPDEQSDIARLLKSPNMHQQLNELLIELATFYLITGNGYLYGVRSDSDNGRIIGLYNMPSNMVRIVFGDYINPIRGYRFDWIDDVIDARDVLHIKTVNPRYDTTGVWLYGLSPIVAASGVMSLSNYTYDTQLSMFQRYGVTGLLTPEKDMLTQTDVEAIKDVWSEIAASRKGDVMAVGVPLRWINVGISPVDMQVIEQQKLTLRDLCMIYGVPSQLFGDSEHSTYNNMREARKALIMDAVLPLMERIKDGLNRFIGSEEYVIDYDLQAFSELQDDITTQVAALSQAWWLTPNERRVSMGRQRLDDEMMDEVLIPSGYIPISDYGAVDDGNEDGNDDEL